MSFLCLVVLGAQSWYCIYLSDILFMMMMYTQIWILSGVRRSCNRGSCECGRPTGHWPWQAAEK